MLGPGLPGELVGLPLLHRDGVRELKPCQGLGHPGDESLVLLEVLVGPGVLDGSLLLRHSCDGCWWRML